MKKTSFTALFADAPELRPLWPQLDHGRHLLTGLTGSAKTLLIEAAITRVGHPLLVVASDRNHAEELVADLGNRLAASLLYQFAVDDVLSLEAANTSLDERNDRIGALNFLLSDQQGVVVTTLAGLRRLLPPVADWRHAGLTIGPDSEVDPAALGAQLVASGYRRDSLVSAPGQFAIRGGIIDVYPLDRDNPVRIELFDTEVDSIREFDADNQRSLDSVDSVTLPPANDMLADEQRLNATADRIQRAVDLTDAARAAGTKAHADGADALDVNAAFVQRASRLVADLREGIVDGNLANYAAALYPEQTTITDYLPAGAVVFFDDYPRLLDTDATSVDGQSRDVPGGELMPTLQPLPELEKADKHPHVLISLFQKGMGNLRLTSITNVATRNVQQFFSQMPLFKTEADRWAKQGQTVVVLVNDQRRAEKTAETMHDFEIDASIASPKRILLGRLQVIVGNLEAGFELPSQHLVVISEHDLFNAKRVRKARHQTLANAERLKSYNELKPGDYVVHVNHGIGQYQGLQTLTVDGVHRDYLTINYRDNGQLFIPVDQLNLVQKYVSAEGKKPHVNKLGGSEWAKTKRKVAAKIEDIADDLIELYAARQAEKGYAFPPDDDLQSDFEAEFPYPETPDQTRSVKEIKRDMERDRPMDRLLVGDVGFGKTEVALRAAFKAITAGKQVALLVPTTILAQQHFDTMTDRFSDFPISIGMLSRFRTAAQNRATIAGLEDGTVDIVVGTHRLLSKDVHYKSLGLLIVDEEQRFGVKHKERIKQLRSSIDVLTLTATPIPRTLNMSMLGVRDLSVIETPPTNRYPIQTFVMEQDAGAVRSAITRELERGGQVFYLHNRVEDIERTVADLETLVPEARIVYAHGQMSESQLESVIYDFMRGEGDILVTTTIIETGVDMPNVNTLIIEDADHYGLAQLYQLRGRVGRSSRVAYAYFMYRRNKVLTEVAEKRLSAIRDFTELGSGFKIAMRDLSIRGAGNLLGAQQHGFIDSVGYDLYTQMLKEAVDRKRGQAPADRHTDAEVTLSVEAYLPGDYIEDNRQKVELYKRVRETENEEQERELEDDLIDRFGDYPQPVTDLLRIARLKRTADAALVDKIHQQEQKLFVTISKVATEQLAGEPIFAALGATKLRATVAESDGRLVVTLAIPRGMATDDWLTELEGFVTKLADMRTVE